MSRKMLTVGPDDFAAVAAVGDAAIAAVSLLSYLYSLALSGKSQMHRSPKAAAAAAAAGSLTFARSLHHHNNGSHQQGTSCTYYSILFSCCNDSQGMSMKYASKKIEIAKAKEARAIARADKKVANEIEDAMRHKAKYADNPFKLAKYAAKDAQDIAEAVAGRLAQSVT